MVSPNKANKKSFTQPCSKRLASKLPFVNIPSHLTCKNKYKTIAIPGHHIIQSWHRIKYELMLDLSEYNDLIFLLISLHNRAESICIYYYQKLQNNTIQVLLNLVPQIEQAIYKQHNAAFLQKINILVLPSLLV